MKSVKNVLPVPFYDFTLVEDLLVTLEETNALIAVTGTEDFFNFDEKIIRNYWSVIEKCLSRSIDLSNQLQEQVYAER